jgi:hypothetical protein
MDLNSRLERHPDGFGGADLPFALLSSHPGGGGGYWDNGMPAISGGSGILGLCLYKNGEREEAANTFLYGLFDETHFPGTPLSQFETRCPCFTSINQITLNL